MMKFSNAFVTALHYLFELPPLTANLTSVTFNTFVNVTVEAAPEQELEAEPARKKRKRGKERAEALLKCNDLFIKPVLHKNAMRSNVNMTQRPWSDIKSDNNECSHLAPSSSRQTPPRQLVVRQLLVQLQKQPLTNPAVSAEVLLETLSSFRLFYTHITISWFHIY